MNEISQYGLLGTMVSGLVVALTMLWKRLNKKDEEHSKERSEWLKSFQEIAEKSDTTSKETNTIIRETGNILYGLKALLENQNRNK